jgi:YidC/Oxa1 family membrane protein insertase
MDKTGIIVVSLCVLLFGWWLVDQNKRAAVQRQFEATNFVVTAEKPVTGTSPATPAVPALTAPVVFNTNTPEQTLVLTNGRARYTFTSRGGGLKQVELLDYPQTISARWKGKITQTKSDVATLNARVNVPVLAVLGDAGLLGDGNFSLTKTATGVRLEKTFSTGLRLVKDFQFSSNYLVNASVRLENTSGQPLVVPAQEYVVGTAAPMDADDNNFNTYGGAMWYDGVTATDQPLMMFSGGGCNRQQPKTELRAGAGNVRWAAAHNQFFALVAMVKTNEPAQQVVARTVPLPSFQDAGVTATSQAAPQGIQTVLVYPAQPLTANSAVTRQIVLFAGPKEYRRLVHIGEDYDNHVDQVMNFGTGFASFWGVGTFFAKLLLSAMNGLHDLTHLGYGWTIVLITVLIKALFWPLTAASTRSMKRMQQLAPELAALKEKYKDDVQKQTAKTWEIYKKNKVNPMSGCLPMLIQMPVFIGFFTMLRSAIELRGASFLWAVDLSKPDTLFMIPGLGFIPFIGVPDAGLPFNLLPLLMGGAMLWQSHLTPASPGMDPTQQKMMRYMPLIFLLFLYNYSSGLALYWTVNNLLTILQTKMTKSLNVTPAPAGPATIPALTPASKSKK